MTIIERRKERTKKKNYGSGLKKVKVTKQEDLNETVSLTEIFSLATSLKELLELIDEQSNLYTHQNGRNITATKGEQKAFLGINFVIAISKYPPFLNTGK